MKQFRYVNEKGEFDYARYREVQTAGNKRKLAAQWVDEESIRFLAEHIRSAVPHVRFGICHGTRRGNEQAWFMKHLPGATVIGTEISDTAAQFPHTVQWDFHEPNPEWLGKADFVYSNSWDHSHDPPKMFRTWLGQLAPGGVMLIEHGNQNLEITELDPFAATLEEVIALLRAINPNEYTYEKTIKDAPRVRVNGEKEMRVKYVVMRRAFEQEFKSDADTEGPFPLPASAREFFQQESVLRLMAAVRKEFPEARFMMWPDGCTLVALPGDSTVRAYDASDGLRYVREQQWEASDETSWERATREGRALESTGRPG